MTEAQMVTTEKAFIYPTGHWVELEQFVIGKKTDPKGQFLLRSDRWDLSPYAGDFLPTEKYDYFIRFDKLRSFIKPYVKSYCYRQLIGNRMLFTTALVRLPRNLHLADQYFIENNLNSLDEISSQEAFIKFWDAQRVINEDKTGVVRITDWRQIRTRSFWKSLMVQFDIPLYIPRIISTKKLRPTAMAANKTKIIPREVIIQLSNKLALHRNKTVLLNRFNHLRLCVLMLSICAGRRTNEILKAPRHFGPLGPLTRRLSRGSSDAGTLFFTFRPSKGGQEKLVCISPQWEEIAEYCVREIILYSDEVRDIATPEERNLLILISAKNQTKGRTEGEAATMLTYVAFKRWLNGKNMSRRSGGRFRGAMEKWNITDDGSHNGAIYKLRLSQARHSRQNALAQDPDIPLLIKQRDLNHTDPDEQFHYQHSLSDDRDALMHKLRGGELMGNGVNWLLRIVGVDEPHTAQPQGFRQGVPSLLDDRWLGLVNNHPLFIQFNRTTCGYCISPTGLSGCAHYMNCTEAAKGGCLCFITDPTNAETMANIQERARRHRAQQQESLLKGRTVQAGKHEVCAERTEDLYQRGLYQIERLKERASGLKKNLTE